MYVLSCKNDVNKVTLWHGRGHFVTIKIFFGGQSGGKGRGASFSLTPPMGMRVRFSDKVRNTD